MTVVVERLPTFLTPAACKNSGLGFILFYFISFYFILFIALFSQTLLSTEPSSVPAACDHLKRPRTVAL